MTEDFEKCKDRTKYTEETSPILAGKVYCERWSDVKGWPESMMCDEIRSSGKCPAGYK